jgi:hypothetical protein
MADWGMDAEQETAWNEFVQHFRTETLHQLDSSAFVISLVPGEFDVKFAVELGAAIMFDKPLLVVLSPESLVPEHLKRVADELVICDLDTKEGQDQVEAALRRMGDSVR